MTRRRDKITTIAVAVTLLVVGLGIALYPKLTDVRYEIAQSMMAAGAQSDDTSPGGLDLPQDAVAHIEIPSIGVEAYVLEGTDAATLNQGPGHYPDTPLPGQAGNAAIAGHRTMYGHVFHDLHELAEGDRIVAGTREAVTTYEVVEVLVVDDSDTEVVDPTEDDRLTLTTCHPIGSAAQRLVVVAVPSV